MQIAVFNFKGGTAKTTTTLNLGVALATNKRPVALVDLDGQRSLSHALDIEGKTPTAADWLLGESNNLPIQTTTKHLHAIPGDLRMFQVSPAKNAIAKALKHLSNYLVLLDCPPSLGVASSQALINSDRVLIPTLSEPAALKGLAETIELVRAEQANKQIDVLRTRYRPKLVLTREADDLLIEASCDLDFNLLHTTVPENIAIAESFAAKKPIKAYSRKSTGATAYTRLGKEIAKQWGLNR